jgi:hypothetical protein
MVFPLLGMLPKCRHTSNIDGTNRMVDPQGIPSSIAVSAIDTDGQRVCEGMTPLVIPQKRPGPDFKAEQYCIVFESQGEQKGIWLSASIAAGWYLAGDNSCGGFIDLLIIDPLSGAIWTVDPSLVPLFPDFGMPRCTGGLGVVLAYQVAHKLFAVAGQVSEGRL